MTVRFRLIACVLCMLVMAGVAMSANKPGEQVKLSVHTAVEYSDNRDSLDSPNEEDNVDFFLSPRLEGNIQWDNERILLDVFYEPSYRYRSDPSVIQNDSDFQQELGVTYEHGLSRLSQFRLVDRLNITDDPSVQENGSTLRRDSSFMLNSVDASITHSMSSVANVTVGIGHSIKNYNNRQRERESDQDSLGAHLMWWQQVSKRAGIFFTGNLSDYGYGEYEGVDRGFSSVTVDAGMRMKFSSKSHLDLRAGYTSLDYAESGYGSDSAPRALVSAQHSPTPTITLTLGGGYGLRDSDTFPFASQEETSGSLRAEWLCTKKLKLAVGGAYRLTHYSQSTTESVGQAYLAERGRDFEGDTERMVAAVETGYKTGLSTSLGMAYKHEMADSNVGTSFSRNSVRLTWTRDF